MATTATAAPPVSPGGSTASGAVSADADAPQAAALPSGTQGDATHDGAASGAPSTEYALELPDGSPLSAEHVRNLTEVARTHGITPEAAQILLSNQHDAATQIDADHHATWEGQVEGWGKELKADPDIGGEKFKASMGHVHAALTSYWNPEFVTMLDETGLGNHPDFIRGLVKLGAAMSEPGAPINGGPSKGKPGSTIFTNSPEMFSGSSE